MGLAASGGGRVFGPDPVFRPTATQGAFTMSKLSTPWLRPFIFIALAAASGTAAHAARFITEVVAAPPPAPLTETVTVAPHPGWIWHPGYYRWEGNNYVWTGGEWVEPKPGY